jgi:hypothetical protein
MYVSLGSVEEDLLPALSDKSLQRHACIIVLYDQPSTHDDGWGWVDAPGHLRRPLPPRELDFSELLFQAMDLMPQLEDLHLDIRHLGGHAMVRFERRCIRLIAQERRGLPRLRHLRCLGIGLDWRIIDWYLNLLLPGYRRPGLVDGVHAPAQEAQVPAKARPDGRP